MRLIELRGAAQNSTRGRRKKSLFILVHAPELWYRWVTASEQRAIWWVWEASALPVGPPRGPGKYSSWETSEILEAKCDPDRIWEEAETLLRKVTFLSGNIFWCIIKHFLKNSTSTGQNVFTNRPFTEGIALIKLLGEHAPCPVVYAHRLSTISIKSESESYPRCRKPKCAPVRGILQKKS